MKGSITSHCTISSNLSHNVGAIWAHLRPVLTSLPRNIHNIHFLSDGPVSQYRNESTFYTLCCELREQYPDIMMFTWNYHETGHGKGAPDGIGGTCKRTADQVIARGGDITDLKEFASIVSERCPSITANVIEECEIDRMNAVINKNSSKRVASKETLSVHQVTGSASFPNQLTIKSLSCFCNSNGCDHYKLGCMKYETEVQNIHLNSSNMLSDTEDDNLPLSIYVRVNNNQISECSGFVPGVSDYVKAQQEIGYHGGDFVLVKYAARKTECRYAGICSSVDDEDGELRVTFLKLCNTSGTLFPLNESDIADVPVQQVIKKLPVPNLVTNENRVFYQFEEAIDVFEK
nr:unnamed protein product [Callosobruchus analis]